MRSSGRKSGGNRSGRSGGAAGGSRRSEAGDDRGRDARGRQTRKPRPDGRPRPEERRYSDDGPRSGPAGTRSTGQGRTGGKRPTGRPRPDRSRDYEAQLEETARSRQTAEGQGGRGSRGTASGSRASGEQQGIRLQKVLAKAGLGSRRACEELIDQRRVEVNGRKVTGQGVRVDPDRDEIRVDGLAIETQGHLFFALNKPAGVVSTMEDPDGRQCLGDYVTNREARLFHVGRLDTETEGIILLTNHGELAHRLTHPRYGVTKTYLAAVVGPLPRDLGKRLKAGVELDDGLIRADNFRVVESTGRNYLVEVTLHEGRKHIVRRMLAETGFPVDRLVRTRFGPIALGDQKSGWLRRLTNTEVGMLKREVGM